MTDEDRLPAGCPADEQGRPTIRTYLNWLVVGLAFSLPCERQWATILALLFMVLWFGDGRLRHKVREIARDRLWQALLLFILFNVLSLLWSSDPGEGLSYLSKYRYLLLAPMIATSLGPSFRRPAAAAFVGGVGVSLILSALALSGLVTTKSASAVNPAVTMSHLDYSMFLAAACLLVLNHAITAELGRSHRIIWCVISVIIAAGLFLNIGRSGQFAFFGALLIVAPEFWRPRRWWKLPLTTLLVAALLFAVYGLVPVFQDRVDSALFELGQAASGQGFDSNQGKRIAGMIVALDMFKADPMLGAGAGANMAEFRRLLDTKYGHFKDAVYWFPHMHNEYVQVVTEVGLIGLALLVNIFVQLFRRPFPDTETKRAAMIIGAIFLFGFMGDPFFQKQLPVALFAVALGVLASKLPGALLPKGRDSGG